jgi:hypothetical protein
MKILNADPRLLCSAIGGAALSGGYSTGSYAMTVSSRGVTIHDDLSAEHAAAVRALAAEKGWVIEDDAPPRIARWLPGGSVDRPLAQIDWRVQLGQRFDALPVWGTGTAVGHIVAQRWYHESDVVLDAQGQQVPSNGITDPTDPESLCVWEDRYDYTAEDPRTGPTARDHDVVLFREDGTEYLVIPRPKTYSVKKAKAAGERRRTNVAEMVEEVALVAIVEYQAANSDPAGMDPSIRAGALLVDGADIGGRFFSVNDGLSTFIKAGDPTLISSLLDAALASGNHDWLTADVVASLKAPLAHWME